MTDPGPQKGPSSVGRIMAQQGFYVAELAELNETRDFAWMMGYQMFKDIPLVSLEEAEDFKQTAERFVASNDEGDTIEGYARDGVFLITKYEADPFSGS